MMRLRETSGATGKQLKLSPRHISQKTWVGASPANGRTGMRGDVWPLWVARLWAARRLVLAWCANAATALLVILLLLSSHIALKTASFLLSFNFDQERVLLMNTLLMMLVGTAVAGVLFRRRFPAVVGALSYFVLWYLSPFLARVQHPPLGPEGIKQELIPGALTSMTLTLLGIALVFASIGAAIGVAYGELVVTPLVTLAPWLWSWARNPSHDAAEPVLRVLPRTVFSLVLGGVLIYASVLSSVVPGTLLTFGIEDALYRLAPGAHGSNAQAHGTVTQGTYSSPALGGISRAYFIYLPPSYSLAQGERYPVLYMLHGSPGTAHNWVGAGKGPISEDALVAVGKMRETIIVTADGTGPLYTFSEWANSYDGRQRMEDAVAIDLVHYIDSHYRTLPDAADRAIGGNSEGGFGAVNIALHHPEIFGATLSMGGYFDATGPVFGYGRASVPYRAYNSPSAYILTPSGARAARVLRFVICVGSDDGEFYTGGVKFTQQLLRTGAHVTLLKDGGGHSWQLWALELGESMPLLEPPLQPSGTHP